MHLVSIDPAYGKPCAVVEFISDVGIREIASYLFQSRELIENPGRHIPIRGDTNRLAIIEGQWIGKNPKTGIELSRVAGEIGGALRHALGFKVEYIPVWGPKSWIQQHFSVRGKVDRMWAISMALRDYKAAHPKGIVLNEDIAMAWSMAQWWWRTNRSFFV